MLPPRDFKSLASADFATAARFRRFIIIVKKTLLVNENFLILDIKDKNGF